MKKRYKRSRRQKGTNDISFQLTKMACEAMWNIWAIPVVWVFKRTMMIMRKPTLNSRSRLPIVENDRRQHTYLTGGTGTSKSEHIKELVHHYLTSDTKTALVVIDPHGKLAREIARFNENQSNGRLVYIKPDLVSSYAPTLNPLELKSHSDAAVTVQTEEVISVFRELISAGDITTKFTLQMENLLYPCIFTLIHMRNKNLLDLLNFMDPEKSSEYINYALKNLKNPSHRDFFERVYSQPTYGPTRLAISTRLQSIFHSLPVSNFLIGKSSIDLDRCIENKSLIIVDLGDLGDISRQTIGRFVVATLQSYVRRRPQRGVPIHLFIDEAHQFISTSMGRILKESRKFGLHATLAQQIYGEGMSPKMKEIVTGNTAVKIAARNSDKSLRAYAADTGVELEALKNLRKFEYVAKSGDGSPVVYKLKPDTLGTRNSMPMRNWKSMLTKQIIAHYRDLSRKTRSVVIPTKGVETARFNSTVSIRKKNPIEQLGRKPPTVNK